jgi:UDP-N-acetylmuramoyl-tripeptide--D-alanyl-D-alanine ligase
MSGLLRRLPANGFACLNADDAAVSALAASCSCRVVYFGVSGSAELRADNVSAQSGRLEFDLVVGGRLRHVATRFVGTLMLPSVLAALSIIHALDLDLDMAVSDLRQIEPLRRRMGVFSGADKHTYIVDTYKASHWSTLLFVEDIPNMGEGRRVFVLGEVSDIATDSSRKYRQLIRKAAENCDLVIGMGGSAASAAEKVGRLEPGTRVVAARNLADVSAILRDQPPSRVFLKGKRMGRLPILSRDPLWGQVPVLGSRRPAESDQ